MAGRWTNRLISTGDQGFVFAGILLRVVFGHGTLAQLGAELARLGRSRPLVLSTTHQEPAAQALAATLGARVFVGVVMHRPVAVPDKLVGVVAVFGAVGPGL